MGVHTRNCKGRRFQYRCKTQCIDTGLRRSFEPGECQHFFAYMAMQASHVGASSLYRGTIDSRGMMTREFECCPDKMDSLNHLSYTSNLAKS
jgi:hypothetical protein